jgi:glycosyltransferase involved in cell wall biosynthesis
MSAGCLVLGSNNLPVSEVLHDEENGLMVDPFDPSAVCDRIDEVFDHTDRMGMIRQRARATIVGNFDLRKQLLPRWMDLLESISAGRCTAERPALSGLPIRAAQS